MRDDRTDHPVPVAAERARCLKIVQELAAEFERLRAVATPSERTQAVTWRAARELALEAVAKVEAGQG